jgi:hypothetical protein
MVKDKVKEVLAVKIILILPDSLQEDTRGISRVPLVFLLVNNNN